MSADDLRRRIDRWLDGDLPADEEAALGHDLGADADNAALLADRALLHGLLREAARRPPVGRPPAPRRRTAVGSFGWVALALAGCLLGAATVFLPRASAGGAGAMVRHALDAARGGTDRRYAVRVEPAPARPRDPRARATPADSTLWVRDARFVQSTEVDGNHLAWGRDAEGAVWFTLSPRTVAVFGADEIPEALRDVCDLRTLELTTLLESLLADFDLERRGGDGATETIVARPRSRHPRIGTVEIAIDRDTRQVVKAVLERRRRGRLVATVRFTLEETGPRDDEAYRWQAHVGSDAAVLDRDAARGARRELLAEFLRLVARFPEGS